MSKQNISVVRLALAALMCMFRGVWQLYPTLVACALFWVAYLSWDCLWIATAKRQWKPMWCMFACGGALNAIVTLANNGRMPVMGQITDQSSVWILATEHHRFLFLCDRFGPGFSLGDICLATGILLALTMWVSRWAWQRQTLRNASALALSVTATE